MSIKKQKTHQKHKKTYSDSYLDFFVAFQSRLKIGVRKKSSKKVESDRLEIDFCSRHKIFQLCRTHF